MCAACTSTVSHNRCMRAPVESGAVRLPFGSGWASRFKPTEQGEFRYVASTPIDYPEDSAAAEATEWTGCAPTWA